MSQPFLGEIRCFGFNFAPRGWALCEGQILSIAQNSALFSLIGTTYGGNGTSNFALPDLRGRVINSFGQGPGLGNYVQGQTGGTETAQLPSHTHQLTGSGTTGTTDNPSGALLASGSGQPIYTTSGPGVPMSGSALTSSGTGSPSNLQPYLTINYCIALQGIFPSRS